MAGQQGHLAGDHAQPRPATSARLRGSLWGRMPRQHLGHFAAQVEVHDPAGGIERQHRLARIQRRLRGEGGLADGAGHKAAISCEHCEGGRRLVHALYLPG